MGDEDELNVARACADKQAADGPSYDPMLVDTTNGQYGINIGAQHNFERAQRQVLARGGLASVYGRRFALRMVLDGLDQGCSTDEIRRACDVIDRET